MVTAKAAGSAGIQTRAERGDDRDMMFLSTTTGP
jgi:hypothetical protein